VQGPLPAALRWLGRLAEPLYAYAIGSRNRDFDAGKGVRRLPVPVISVGNLTAGGTGKTPMVLHLARALLGAGRVPCIALRGYVPKGSRGGGVEGIARSDEARVYRAELPHVPLAVGPERFETVSALLSAGTRVDCVLLDDGFQHRRLARDLDIVLVDASADVFRQRLIPAGWLREPVTSLSRAGAVVITHAELVDSGTLAALERDIERVHARRPVSVVAHRWSGVAHLVGGADAEHPVEWLRGKRILGVCAIGNPRGFAAALKGVIEGLGGMGSMRMIALPDHDPFAPATVRKIADSARQFGAQAIVVTEKDWVKLAPVPAAQWPCPVVRARLRLEFQRGERELLDLVQGCAAGSRN
jgi:tetraacyldisaccharide 4'-kinase